eukprot:CAMPEP_0118697930 /NCGR_PEP_ID=MMETSP0800-20121206/14861_1 /TAXON_ID=210618 ORGANISM="Striatella unipunctata, Strain CCMP2910" /NCGR_SAMPLE_ID=MMETSP0800 /ASSEMBLY_ACC=CAM_ASM_000638 /LENGTH=246 /DNA_ID=CAMNT_0006597579 /DNA_START=68 /DNA_END=808 /DNA_ORIENTATION=+
MQEFISISPACVMGNISLGRDEQQTTNSVDCQEPRVISPPQLNRVQVRGWGKPAEKTKNNFRGFGRRAGSIRQTHEDDDAGFFLGLPSNSTSSVPLRPRIRKFELFSESTGVEVVHSKASQILAAADKENDTMSFMDYERVEYNVYNTPPPNMPFRLEMRRDTSSDNSKSSPFTTGAPITDTTCSLMDNDTTPDTTTLERLSETELVVDVFTPIERVTTPPPKRAEQERLSCGDSIPDHLCIPMLP